MVRAEAGWLVDEYGRKLLLRGVNLGGSTKVPAGPEGGTWNPEGFFDHRNVSFVGRPFPLDEADEHFARLREWGLTLVRFLVTWEAIEHAGPGIYDETYLDYVRAVLERAAHHGIGVFVDPHQDVWSRFSGGSGAPGWTFDVVGMDITKFGPTDAALVHATYGDPFPCMIWPTNEGKLANLTMWSLFFGGDDFAPESKVDGVPIQVFLQDHYIRAVQQVALRVRDLPNVVGYDTLNEPSSGMIGMTDLEARASALPQGPCPTAFQAMRLGAGHPEEVTIWDVGLTGERRVGRKLVNPEGVSVWKDGHEPIWRRNGVWDLDSLGKPRLLRPHHFARVRGRKVDFHRDYLRPFANRYARAIRAVHPGALIFVEGVPHRGPVPWSPEDAPNIAFAPHWYDALTLFTKRFRRWFTVDLVRRRPVFGARRVLRVFTEQIASLKRAASVHMNNAPMLIGEVGIPFDMHERRAYETGDFSRQVAALDTTMRALERNLVPFTLWNYTADNSNARGDHWNDEDLSLFCCEQQTGCGDRFDGGRALEAAVRPYAEKVAGTPLHQSFDRERRRYTFRFRHDPEVAAPTELFVPRFQYPDGARVSVSAGSYKLDMAAQRLVHHADPFHGIHTLTITAAAD